MTTKHPLVKVAKRDLPWVTPEVASEVLRRQAQRTPPVKDQDLRAELAEMERLGL